MNIRVPKPTGEYAVGTFTYTVKNDRKEVMVPGTLRSVAARVYYPALKESVKGLKKEKNYTRNVIIGLKRMMPLPLNYDKLEAAGQNESECYLDVPKISGVKFPLILFNHGYGSYREGNSFLCAELASHGYVVISVAHSLEAVCVEFDDGSYIFSDKKAAKKLHQPLIPSLVAMSKLQKMKGTEKELADKFDEIQRKYSRFGMDRIDEWVKDCEAALLYAKTNFSDMIDFEKGIGATGLSFGGNTAYRLCTRKPEIKCGINIDGALFGDYTKDTLNKPFIQISCEGHTNVVTRALINHSEPVYRVVFRDMKHVGFSDMKHAMKPGNAIGKLDADMMHENLCRCHLELFDTYLKGIKSEPELKSNDVITVKKYEKDI